MAELYIVFGVAFGYVAFIWTWLQDRRLQKYEEGLKQLWYLYKHLKEGSDGGL